jgi:hypothetical protein
MGDEVFLTAFVAVIHTTDGREVFSPDGHRDDATIVVVCRTG